MLGKPNGFYSSRFKNSTSPVITSTAEFIRRLGSKGPVSLRKFPRNEETRGSSLRPHGYMATCFMIPASISVPSSSSEHLHGSVTSKAATTQTQKSKKREHHSVLETSFLMLFLQTFSRNKSIPSHFVLRKVYSEPPAGC